MSLNKAVNIFIRKDVQNMLRSLTETNLEKVLEKKFNTKAKRTKLELLTNEALDEVTQMKLIF
jgi:hypothetical protein